jgi:hypothetical protein
MALGGGQHKQGISGTNFMELFALLAATCDMSAAEVDALQRLMSGVKARYGSGDKRLDCKTLSYLSCIIHSGREVCRPVCGCKCRQAGMSSWLLVVSSLAAAQPSLPA